MTNPMSEEGGAVALPTPDPITTAMAAGAGYNTGAVKWTTGRQHTPSPNRAAIRQAMRVRRRWLRKHGHARPDLAAIGNTIATCGHRRLRDRCGHPACPRCAGALQRLLVETVAHFLEVEGAGEPWMIVSVILPPRGASGDIEFAIERDRYAPLMRQAGITRGVFGLDFSFNEDRRRSVPEAERFEPHASVHLFGFAPAAEVRVAEAKLKRLVPATKVCPRPVRVDDFDGGLSGLAYAFKPNFECRQSIEQFDRRRGKLGRNTRHCPKLTVEQGTRAVRALDRGGLTGRIVLLGLRFAITETGRLCLILAT